MTRARLALEGTRSAGLGAATPAGHLFSTRGTRRMRDVNIHKGRVVHWTRPFPPGCLGGEELRRGWKLRDGPGGMAAQGPPTRRPLPPGSPGHEKRTWRERGGARDPERRRAPPLDRPLGARKAWAPVQAPGVGAAVRPAQSGRAASAFGAACVSCGFRPGEEGLPAGNPGCSQQASSEPCAGGGETGALAAVSSPRRGDLGRRCWEL